MIVALKIIIIGFAVLICYQDIKDRLVYWFLFPLMGIGLALIFFQYSTPSFFLLSLGTNVLLVSSIVGVLYIYSRLIIRKKFLNHSLGFGDILFFYAFAVGFPPITFIILFAGAVFFSLISYLVLKKTMRIDTVPLAGLMGIFVILIICCSFFVDPYMLYTS